MPITANSRQPKPPRRTQQSILSWIFFLLIFARPFWGILRSMIGPEVSDTPIWIMVAGITGLGIRVLFLLRAMRGGPANTSLPPRMELPRPVQPMQRVEPLGPSADAQRRAPPIRDYPLQPPRFEPIITGKVVVAGIVLAMVMIAVILLVGVA